MIQKISIRMLKKTKKKRELHFVVEETSVAYTCHEICDPDEDVCTSVYI